MITWYNVERTRPSLSLPTQAGLATHPSRGITEDVGGEPNIEARITVQVAM